MQDLQWRQNIKFQRAEGHCSARLGSGEQPRLVTWVLAVEGAPVHLALEAALGGDGRRPPVGQGAADGGGRVPSCRPVHAVELNGVT